MSRKYLRVAKSVISVTIAASVLAAAYPTSVASASSKAEQAVIKAEKLGAALKWEISLEYRKAKYPNNFVGLPNMKLFDEAKRALVDARKVVGTLKGKDKEVLSARLDANSSTYITRTIAYIDAVTSGQKIQKKSKELQTLYDKGILDNQTEKLYHELNTELKKNSAILDRVYGETTRSQFRNVYKQPAVTLVNKLIFPLNMKTELEKAVAALEVGQAEMAAEHLENADYFLKEALKKGQKESDTLLADLITKQKAVQTDFNNYVASHAGGQPSANLGSGVLNSFSANVSVLKIIDPVENKQGGFPQNLPGTYDPETNTGTVSFAHLDLDTTTLMDLEIKTVNAEKFKVTYINSENGAREIKTMPLEYRVVNGKAKISMSSIFFGDYFLNLRGYCNRYGKYMKIKGNLIDSNNKEGKEITIILNF